MIPSETPSSWSRIVAESAEVIGTRNDDPDNPALSLGQGAERGEKFLPVEMEVPRTAGRLFVHRAKFRIGKRPTISGGRLADAMRKSPSSSCN